MKDTILKELQTNPVTQQMIHFGNNIGNLFPNEEALCLASAFQMDKKTRIVVKKNRYEAQQPAAPSYQSGDSGSFSVLPSNDDNDGMPFGGASDEDDGLPF